MGQSTIPKRIFKRLVRAGLFNRMSDEMFLKLSYHMNFGKKIDLNNPVSFNEKLQWLKLHDRKAEYIKYVDKYEVRNFIEEQFGSEILIPIYGVWDSVEDIDFDKLPEKFVLKCTHDSGSVCICENKATFDFQGAKRKLQQGMRHNLFYWGREWPYKGVKPRIIAEKYMSDSSGTGELTDYKLMCFNGKVRCSFTGTDRFSGDGLKITFFDLNWNRMPFERHYPADPKPIPKPKSYDRMIDIAERISCGHPFMRIDFYEIDGCPYFGEITLYPGNGMEEFTPEIWDKKLGDMIDISEV